MRIGRVVLKNFQSFEELEFNYADQGLTLVSGQTKAGKSTLLDAVPWIVFGITSKDSLSDDVRSWFAKGPTEGSVEISTPQGSITVTRIRGTSKQNDLYWTEADGTIRRGKDASETQLFISQRLGVSPELFLDGSYLHQFSRADTFFLAKAKDRREILERVADLSLPVRLAEGAVVARKETNEKLKTLHDSQTKLQGKHEHVTTALKRYAVASNDWEEKQKHQLAKLAKQAEDFQKDKSNRILKLADQIDRLSVSLRPEEEFDARIAQTKTQIKLLETQDQALRTNRKRLAQVTAEINVLVSQHGALCDLNGLCPTCLAPVSESTIERGKSDIEEKLQSLVDEQDSLTASEKLLEQALSAKFTVEQSYTRILQERSDNGRAIDRAVALRQEMEAVKEERNTVAEQYEYVKSEQNPYLALMAVEEQTLTKTEAELRNYEDIIEEAERRVQNLSWLYDTSMDLRGRLLEQAVKGIETRTNEILERFFDAELRVSLTLPDADKLVVTIQNEGYECPYKQLSGGERCLLKLAFMLAYMKAAENRAGVKFENLMLDESFNGLDSVLKTKAFGLLQVIAEDYSSVFVIEHSEEFKQLFSNQFLVEKNGAFSTVSHLTEH